MRFIAVLLLCLTATAAHSKTRHVEPQPFDRHAIHSGGSEIGSRMFIRNVKVARHVKVKRKHQRLRLDIGPHKYAARFDRTAQIVAHPVGCPSRAFCGCGAALEVFGKHVRELWLAANWFRFPRAEPAPGMVAVRSHHVFVIREVRAPGLVLAYDANSGGHRTRIHLRSLTGYRVVNPSGTRYAQAP